MTNKFKQDKGQAGLTILLSVVVMLFVIGLLVMIFSLMSSEIQDQDMLYERTSSANVTGEATTQALMGSANGDPFTMATLRSPVCTIVEVYNGTGGLVIASGNYTSGTNSCYLKNTTSTFSTVNWAVNYTYTYLADQYGTAGTMNDTSTAIAGVTDWFDIFVVITAMVVLILLTVIIITAIRSSGMVAGGSSTGANQVGTA